MAAVWTYVADQYYQFQDANEDHRVKGWLLTENPLATILIGLTYAFLVTVVGPLYMANRRPYVLKHPMMVYNVVVVALNVWLFYQSAWLYAFEYTFACQPVPQGTDLATMGVVAAVWWCYISKFIDLIDTAFLVLKKKEVSMLHLIHHTIMPFTLWITVKFAPGGHTVFVGLVNCFVHVIMYSYYFLAALGPSMRPYLWWKKYLTTLQLVQFVMVFLHSFQLLFVDCDYPKFITYYEMGVAILFFGLFWDFYTKTYKNKANAAKKKNA